jgi:DNA-binding response OmpR family regulator
LEPLGYMLEAVHDGKQGLQRAISGDHAAVILDVMLPGQNGIDVLRQIRERSQVPVLMLTALGDEPDRVAGLEIGADDYLPKTSSTRELLARLRAVLRRSVMTARRVTDQTPGPVVVGALTMDPGARTASLAGSALVLTAIEYDLLIALARAAGRVKTREQLLLEVAERDFETFDRSIDVHIAALRKKLGDDARQPRFIETVRGVGYKMRKPEEA